MLFGAAARDVDCAIDRCWPVAPVRGWDLKVALGSLLWGNMIEVQSLLHA